MDKNDNIKKASNELKRVSGDYELRRIAELKEKYIRDEQARMAYALEKCQKEGFDKGMEQGIEQGISKIVKNMLANNIDKKQSHN